MFSIILLVFLYSKVFFYFSIQITRNYALRINLLSVTYVVEDSQVINGCRNILMRCI